MLLNNQDLMSEFYEEIEEDYPDITYEQLKEICFGSWRYVKKEMESGKLPTIRMKYFGVFRVHPSRAKYMLYCNEINLRRGHITEEQYKQYKNMIDEFLMRYEESNNN